MSSESDAAPSAGGAGDRAVLRLYLGVVGLAWALALPWDPKGHLLVLVLGGLGLVPLLAFLGHRGVPAGRLGAELAVGALVVLFVANLVVLGVVHFVPHWKGGLVDPPHPVTGWAPRPNILEAEAQGPAGAYRVSTDARGLRNPYPYPAGGKVPWLLQGDSNVYGFGLPIEQTLAVHLNRGCGVEGFEAPARFYSAGVRGFDVHQFFFQYEELAKDPGAARRLLAFNPGNDFTNAALLSPYFVLRPYLAQGQGGALEAHRDAYPRLPYQAYGVRFQPAWSRYDVLIREPEFEWARWVPPQLEAVAPLVGRLFVTGALIARKLRPLRYRVFGEPSVPPELLGPGGRFLSGFGAFEGPLWLHLEPEHWPPPFPAYRAQFEAVMAGIRDQAPGLKLLYLPLRAEVLATARKNIRANLEARGFAPEAIRPDAFRRYFRGVCARLGLELVDPTPEFLAHPRPEELYQPNNEHLSGEGFRVCAEVFHREAVGACEE